MEEHEITEGMSSEELDALTLGEEDVSKDAEAEAEAKAALEAEEALKETEEDADPKDAVIGEFRRKARDLEIEKARLEGELEARKTLQTETQKEVAPEKSPLEIAEAAYIEENGDLDGFAMTGGLYREQQAFDRAADQKEREVAESGKVKSTMELTAANLQEGDLSPEKAGEGLDLKSMCSMGDKYLTRGDNLDLADIQAKRGTAVALKEAYSIMKRRILLSGTEDAAALQKAIDAKSKTPVVKKKNKETDIDALITGEDGDLDEVDDDAPRVDRLTNFIFS